MDGVPTTTTEAGTGSTAQGPSAEQQAQLGEIFEKLLAQEALSEYMWAEQQEQLAKQEDPQQQD